MASSPQDPLGDGSFRGHDEAERAEANRERGFGLSATRRGEILVRHPCLDLTNPQDMTKWFAMNQVINEARDKLKNIDTTIEVVVSLPGNRTKRSS